jgi:hypothetical protein
MYQCKGKTISNLRCKNKITLNNKIYCHLHKNIQKGGTQIDFKPWLIKEIKKIGKNINKYFGLSYQDLQTYIYKDNIVMWSIEEDDSPDKYFITFGKNKNKLKVKVIHTNGDIEKWIKKNYPKYVKDNSYNEIIEETFYNTFE